MAMNVPAEQGPWRTFGPLIHNKVVNDTLAGNGVTITDDIDAIKKGGVLIRTHGVAPAVFNQLAQTGAVVKDATCPLVRKVQRLGERLVNEGCRLVVVGDAKHPEVQGIVGWADGKAWVAETPGDLAGFKPGGKIAVICQTTKTRAEFEAVINALAPMADEIQTFDTICEASVRRQEAARLCAGCSEIMVVVGDRSSSNTRSLVKVCAAAGAVTYQVETSRDLMPEWFQGVQTVGITAGASTPDWLIKEVVDWMSEFETNETRVEQASTPENAETAAKPQETVSSSSSGESSFAQMEAEFAESLREVERGRIVKGVVIQVTNDEVMVDVGGKSEGVIPFKELSVQDVNSAKDILKVGDEIDVMVLRWDDEGQVVLSKRRVDKEKYMDVLEKAFENGEPVTGTVTKEVKGGLLVDLGVLGFLPASQVEDGFVKNLDVYVGKEFEFKIIEFNRTKRRGSQVVVSRRQLLEKDKAAKKESFWAEIAEGQTRKGLVKRLTTYGAFIDLGGYEGLLHISEMDHARISKPSDVLTEGQEIEVFILGVDNENERVSLSRKRILKSPWEDIAERYPENSVVSGRVVRVAPFGAFVELEPGVDGLIHISQLANRRVAKCEEVVQIGQEIQVKVLAVDPAERRIALSLKGLEEDAEEAQVREYLENQDDSESAE